MKKFLHTAVKYFKLKKKINNELLWLTKNIPCVNLSVYGVHTLRFYNNSDLVLTLSIEQAEKLFLFGSSFFRCVLYSLCKKYSIDNY